MQSKNELFEYCNKLIVRKKAYYKRIGRVYCPALRKIVVFNAKGFHHLLHEANGEPRTVNERIYKLNLLPLAKSVIQYAKNITEQRDVSVRANPKNSASIKIGKSYSLVAKVGRKRSIRVRVILLQIGNGKLVFRSIMKD